MKYRPEIDGMRAFAVIAVVLFHAGFSTLSGGFIGVDVFFVISGYLITTIIVSDLNAGSFTYRKFFERRVRRILPALIFVSLACVPFAYFWMLPDELQNFGQSLFATGLSVNNVLLEATSGYWAMDADYKPLLHTWSLGVEEQYYVVVPILLAMLWRLSRRAVPIAIVVLGLGSLVLADVMIDRSPKFAFFMLPTRAWELAAGALTALILIRNPRLRHLPQSPALAAGGLILVLAPVFIFGETTDTPGLPLLVPVLGTCLVVCFAAQDRGVGRLLSARPVVAIGLMSFSAYLWHQPLFAFARVYAVQAPPAWVTVGLAAASFALAWATWKYVETPFRSQKRTSRGTVFATAATGVAAMAAIGLGLHVTDGLPARLPAASNADNATIAYNRAVFDLKVDAFSDANRRHVLIVGNSFARDFVNSVREAFPSDQLRTLEIVYRDDFPPCVDDAAGILRTLYDDAEVVITPGDVAMACAEENVDVVTADGKDFLVVGTKAFGENLNWLMRSGDWTNQTNEVPEATLAMDAHDRAALPSDNYVSWLEPVLVDKTRIPITDDEGRLLTTDKRHFSQAGARYFGERVLRRSQVSDVLFNK